MKRLSLRRTLVGFLTMFSLAALAVPQLASATPKWSIQETPSFPSETGGGLQSVSCPSSESCTVVGHYDNIQFGPTPLVERWNGTGWSFEELATPTGALTVEMTGVSCGSTEFCIAVGTYENTSLKVLTTAEFWNGKEWTLQTPGSPTGATRSQLLGVSCMPAARWCAAVGNYVNSSKVQVPLAEIANGNEWIVSATAVPTGAKTISLSGVSCISSEACTAVGQYTNSGGMTVPLAERWNGTAWAIQGTTTVAGAITTKLSGVSCASEAACTAVGHYINSANVEVPLAERWNGTAWSVQEPPSPSGAKSSSLSGVSCVASEACTATGSYVNSSNVKVTLAERWTGGAWTIQTTANPGEASSLAGVSCSSTMGCVAVGTSARKTLAEHWNGTEWTVHSTPTPPLEEEHFLYGVSCTEPKACTAVGALGLAERWNGSAWTIEKTPLRSNLRAVSCTSATACTAVGYTGPTAATLAETWDGTKWKTQTTPTPTEAIRSYLFSVSCTSATECTATGVYEKSSTKKYTLAERWNGTEWKIQPTVSPGEGTSTDLTGVSCTSATSCEASGFYFRAGERGEFHPMAEHWNGTEWTLQKVPTQVEETETLLDAISCTSSIACTAMGEHRYFSAPRTAAERYIGQEWASQSIPNPTGESILHGVSCASAAACTAVGSTRLPEGWLPFAEAWNGTEWAIQATPTPSGTDEGELYATSCTSATVCVAVGYSRQDDERVFAEPLVERYE
jgi:hypothetical protein